MKTPGPPPTPTNLKLLRGNPGKRKLNTNEPDPEPAIPPCPSHLDKVAKKEWRRVSKELLALGDNLEAGSRRSRRLLRRVRPLGGGGTTNPEIRSDLQIAERLPDAVAVSGDSSYGARPNARVPHGVRIEPARARGSESRIPSSAVCSTIFSMARKMLGKSDHSRMSVLIVLRWVVVFFPCLFCRRANELETVSSS